MKKLFIIFLLLIFVVPIEVEAKGRSGHSSGNSSYSGNNSSYNSGKSSHPKTYCTSCARDKNGKIKRDSNERKNFLESKGLTHTPEGYQVDHIVPLAKGGADKKENMQLIPKNSEKEKNELK